MTEKLKRNNHRGPFAAVIAFAAVAAATSATAQQPNFQVPAGTFNPGAQQYQLPALPTPQAITANGSVVEDVIARVNDQIITRSEYERARKQMVQDAQQAQVPMADLQDRLNNLLRDMIDQQLLLSKGKELGITGDAETMRQLDEIRKQNHLDSMEALEKAAAQQGVSFEDFKQRIKDQIVSREVVNQEVGRRLNMTHAQEQAYYDAHAKDFEVPEQVHLSEILIPTPDNATDAQVTAAQAKADDAAAKLKAGANFADLAKSVSGGPNASAGGDLGDFQRGKLGTVLENATFSLPAGGVTAPIRTRQGFVILRVDNHQQAGVPPLSQVEPQVQQALYVDAMQPALRAYLTKQREEAYVEIAKGFTDTGSAKRSTKPDLAYTSYKAPAVKKKILKKQRLEQVKAQQAQAALAAAREKVAEKQAAKAREQAAKAGVQNVDKPVKPKKIRREKIRYGQAPRNALPPAPEEASATSGNGPIQGQAPGVAMAPTEAITSISTGTGADADSEDDPLAPKEGAVKKTRFAARQTEQEEQHAKTQLAKAEAKATTRPVPTTPDVSATEKHQAGPLGLNGDTVAKQPKKKRKKGEAKERLQDKPKPVEPAPPAPTVNPAVVGAPTGLSTTTQGSQTAPANTSDKTTLPPTTTGAPGANPTGQPIPATTSADPKAQQPQ